MTMPMDTLMTGLSWVPEDNDWVDVPWTTHPVRPWCQEEYCYFCPTPASHKIEETTGPRFTHPMTAYVCCEHFFGHCEGNTSG